MYAPVSAGFNSPSASWYPVTLPFVLISLILAATPAVVSTSDRDQREPHLPGVPLISQSASSVTSGPGNEKHLKVTKHQGPRLWTRYFF